MSVEQTPPWEDQKISSTYIGTDNSQWVGATLVLIWLIDLLFLLLQSSNISFWELNEVGV